jgi:hypothetical protein
VPVETEGQIGLGFMDSSSCSIHGIGELVRGLTQGVSPVKPSLPHDVTVIYDSKAEKTPLRNGGFSQRCDKRKLTAYLEENLRLKAINE